MLDTMIPKGIYSTKCMDSLDNLGKHSSVPLSKHGFRFHSSEIEILEHAYIRRRARTPNRQECEQFAQAFNNSEPRRRKNTNGWQARWPLVNAKQIKTWFENKRQKDKREKFINDPSAIKEIDKPLAKLATAIDCDRWVSVELLGPKDDALPYLPPMSQLGDYGQVDKHGELGKDDDGMKRSYNIREWLKHHICNEEIDRLPLVDVIVNSNEVNKEQDQIQLQQQQHQQQQLVQSIAQLKQQHLARAEEGFQNSTQSHSHSMPQSHIMRPVETSAVEEALLREASLNASQPSVIHYPFFQQPAPVHTDVPTAFGMHTDFRNVHHSDTFSQMGHTQAAHPSFQPHMASPGVSMLDAFDILRNMEGSTVGSTPSMFNMKVPTS